jgi:L-asparaginase II
MLSPGGSAQLGSTAAARESVTARVRVVRGDTVESEHLVHVAVSDGRALVASAGDPRVVTFLRSAAKPVQALPVVEDGVARRFRFTDSELALCCASHNAEPRHVRAALSILRKAGLEEGDLACGPHPPMGVREAARMAAAGEEPRSVHNNCSGKHAGMLALAVHHGWPTEGYHRAGHPVQERMRAEIARWTGLPAADLGTGVDGCGVVTFAVPVAAMARALARFGRAAAEEDPGPAAVVDAIAQHPFMIAGTARLCTELIETTHGRIVAKTGAEGVYCAMVPAEGLGVALKVEDGARRAADVALVAVLEELGLLSAAERKRLAAWRAPVLRNTRDEVVGEVSSEIALDRKSPRRRRA